MEPKPANTQPTSIGMDKPNSSSAASIVLWITCIIAVAFTVFLFMTSRSYANNVTEKQQSKNALDAELGGSTYKDIETQANSFSEAFSILSAVSNTRKAKADVLKELSASLTKDVKLKTMTIGDGIFSADGSTSSYRAVADFMTALKQNKKISNVKLVSAALNTEENVSPSEKITFSVTANIDTNKDAPVDTATSQNSGSATTDSSVDSLGQ